MSYKLYRRLSSGSYSLLAVVNEVGYTDTSVLAGTTYYYGVAAVDSMNAESASSTSVSATTAGTMHVQSISMNPLTRTGQNVKASATATVVSSAHSPLPAATVTAQWWVNRSGTSALLQTQTGTTGSNGTVTFTSDKIKALSGSTFTLRITGVVLTGYVFAPLDGVTEATSGPVP